MQQHMCLYIRNAASGASCDQRPSLPLTCNQRWTLASVLHAVNST